MPLDVLKGKTPHEVLFGKKPDYTHLKVFGCLCFVSTLNKDRKKFMQRAQKGVFIDYYPGKKGYKVYNLETKNVIVSKDVVFYEHHFPYQYSKKKEGINLTKQIFLPACTNYNEDILDPFAIIENANNIDTCIEQTELINAEETLSQLIQQPRDTHWNALQHTLHYVHSICGQGIILSTGEHITLQAFSDSELGIMC